MSVSRTDVAVEVRAIASMPELTDAMEALRSIWSLPGNEGPISAEIMRAIALAGGYVAGAYVDDTLVGAAAGFLGLHDGVTHLHSHIAGVVAEWQGHHVGLALKQHQRAWANERGIAVIEWTFDPLVRRNAYFNLVKLGATISGYEPDFYGEMRDAINAGDATDRAIVHWDRAAERSGDADGAVILEPGAAGPVEATSDAPVLRAWIPEDIVELRRTDPDAARAWRYALRDTFGAAIRAGYVARSITRDGWYTLVKS